MELNKVIQGDCLEVMKTLPDNSVDAVVTDPPYGLSFMGKKWDYDVPSQEIWEECLRVLKPGGYLLSFGGTRTYHRMASAIEDAGFEVRDMVSWIYGSGFPKSRNIGLDVDKMNGITQNRGKAFVVAGQSGQRDKDTGGDLVPGSNTIGAYKAQNEWSGWGTALKPAHEPICMARKPLAEKTIAQNVLKYGTGGINIDESRVAANWKEERPESWFNSGKSKSGNPTYDGNLKSLTESTVGERLNDGGRFPANLIHDGSDEVVSLFPETKSGGGKTIRKNEGAMFDMGQGYSSDGISDSGSASRFFYCAKASKSERNRGCEELEEKQTVGGGGGIGDYLNDVNSASGKYGSEKAPSKNNHPTVKPLALMEYLVKLVTKKGGIVLDPFAGSGSTLIAAKKNGFQYIGIEMTAEYIPIIEARLKGIKKDNTLF